MARDFIEVAECRTPMAQVNKSFGLRPVFANGSLVVIETGGSKKVVPYVWKKKNERERKTA
jgi:hypothetical protein